MILAKYSELILKSPRTRIFLEKKLIENIKNQLGKCKIKKVEGGVLEIEGDEYEKLRKVFGIDVFLICKRIKTNVDKIVKKCVELSKDFSESFAVRVKRVGKHEFTSQELAAKCGEKILEVRNLKVDLKNPKNEIFIEVRNENTYIGTELVRCEGGLPIGSQGKVLALISGGIDSPVAAWMMMKRGCEIELIHFDNFPFVSKENLKKVKKLRNKLQEWSSKKIKLYVVPHGENLKKFIESAKRSYTCILCKRMMYRISNLLAKKIGANAVVTGESLGQVASQTLHNLMVNNLVSELPILRPLIGLNKDEIVKIARKIGTYEISIEREFKCGAVPRHPETKANFERLRKFEEEIDVKELAEESMKNIATF